jgi:hypothetical protein
MLLKQRKLPDRWILAIKGYSNNPGDTHLQTVLCYIPGNELTPYATWLFNMQDGGFHWGHYHRHINEAIPEFMTRGPIPFDDKFIKQHDAIECHYICYIENNTAYDQCEADEAQMVGVYLHKPEGGIVSITDHLDGKDAMRIVRWISNRYELPVQYQPKDVHYVKLNPIEEV